MTYCGTHKVASKVVNILAEIATTNDQRVINSLVNEHGLIQKLYMIVHTVTTKEVLAEVMFTLCNLVADSRPVADQVIMNADLVSEISDCMQHTSQHLRKEATLTACVLLFTADITLVMERCMKNKTILENIFQTCEDLRQKLPMVAEMTDLVKRLCQTDLEMKLTGELSFKFLIEIAGGRDLLEKLSDHPDLKTRTECQKIVHFYFGNQPQVAAA